MQGLSSVGSLPVHAIAVGDVRIELDLNLGADLVARTVDDHDIPVHQITADWDVILTCFAAPFADSRFQGVPFVEGLYPDSL